MRQRVSVTMLGQASEVAFFTTSEGGGVGHWRGWPEIWREIAWRTLARLSLRGGGSLEHCSRCGPVSALRRPQYRHSPRSRWSHEREEAQAGIAEAETGTCSVTVEAQVGSNEGPSGGLTRHSRENLRGAPRWERQVAIGGRTHPTPSLLLI